VHAAHNRTADRRRIGSFLRLAGRPFEQRDAALAQRFAMVSRRSASPRQFDHNAHSIVQHLDPAAVRCHIADAKEMLD
jgi:hypothetical protein